MHALRDRAADAAELGDRGRLLHRRGEVGAGDAGAGCGGAPVPGEVPMSVRTWWATPSRVTRPSVGSAGTAARSTPRRSASWRAAAVAATGAPATAGRGAAATAAGVAVTPSRSALTMRPPGPVPRTARRSMPRSLASRLAIGDAMIRPPVGAAAATAGADVGAAAAVAAGGGRSGRSGGRPGRPHRRRGTSRSVPRTRRCRRPGPRPAGDRRRRPRHRSRSCRSRCAAPGCRSRPCRRRRRATRRSCPPPS